LEVNSIARQIKNFKGPQNSLLHRIYLFFLPVILVAVIIIYAGSVVLDNYLIQEQAKENIEQEKEQITLATIYTGELEKNSSLYTELLRQDVPELAVAKITTRFSELFDLTNSHQGDEFKLFLSPGDTVLAFEYITTDLKKYRLEKVDDDYIDKVTEVELDKHIEFIGVTLETNLWAALHEKLPDHELFTKITDIFAWEIDFFTESRVGDTFKMVYQAFYKEGQFIKAGDILAVEYVLEGTAHRAFLYTDPDGFIDYYDENGYSLRRALLKSPLNYRRISSRFSRSRLHPVLKIYRPHLGIDYAAEIGTPVAAAGDGIVTIKDMINGFGKYLEIEHEFGLTTGYGHLRNFAQGIEKGRRVRQGQVIGYVGETGITTGPHLDYRVKKDGKYVNPLQMTIPASSPVKREFMPEFQMLVANYIRDFDKPVEREMYVLNQ